CDWSTVDQQRPVSSFIPILDFLDSPPPLSSSVVALSSGLSPSALCPLPSALCPLPSALCPLPSALCPLPSALCPFALCPLPFCLLLPWQAAPQGLVCLTHAARSILTFVSYRTGPTTIEDQWDNSLAHATKYWYDPTQYHVAWFDRLKGGRSTLDAGRWTLQGSHSLPSKCCVPSSQPTGAHQGTKPYRLRRNTGDRNVDKHKPLQRGFLARLPLSQAMLVPTVASRQIDGCGLLSCQHLIETVKVSVAQPYQMMMMMMMMAPSTV
ncbi:hypothetical protein IAQ61_001797, partial [Plenodomus lingam]|uniref:uncharacterized protein n=1 Tax=Leptosphaeria maculans TaxID=5022 RepID=UPI0033237682